MKGMNRNKKLVEAREQRHWTQEVAAEKIEVSRVAYARWEEQGIIPRPWAIKKACEAFKMSPEQLGFRKYTPEVKNSSTLLTLPPVRALHVPMSDITVNLLHTGILSLRLAQQQLNWSFEELLMTVEQEMRQLDIMAQEDHGKDKLSRREVISLLMAIPIAASGISQTRNTPILHDDEMLALCTVNVPLAWRLYFSGGLAEVRHILPNYITMLSPLALQHSRYQKQAASLASQAHQLGYLLALQSQDFSVAQSHAKQALQYAAIAEEPNLYVAALVRQGNLFYTLKRPIQTAQKYQEAIEHSHNASPLIVGQAYIGLAEAQGHLGQEQEALRSKGLALDTFPVHPEDDLHFTYTHFNHFTRTNFEGLMYLHLGKPSDAWEVFAEIDKAIPLDFVPQRVELLSRQALTSVALGEMHQSCTYVEQAVTSALKLGSDLRYNEACETYLQMQEKWPNEQRVKELADLFQQQ